MNQSQGTAFFISYRHFVPFSHTLFLVSQIFFRPFYFFTLFYNFFRIKSFNFYFLGYLSPNSYEYPPQQGGYPPNPSYPQGGQYPGSQQPQVIYVQQKPEEKRQLGYVASICEGISCCSF
ncbi:hypothetical protein AYI69_g9281 [Smittium culicis]|uniref:Uncharacterized protein n=1 Tax=Smittium culicis TaxID=133412 RepID=A0A1R1XDQ0_9FUNG|nr:hypothetical protein AYI69_g9281 [Smittium culicis]